MKATFDKMLNKMTHKDPQLELDEAWQKFVDALYCKMKPILDKLTLFLIWVDKKLTKTK